MWSVRFAVLLVLWAGPCVAGQSVIPPPSPEEAWTNRQYFDLDMSVHDGGLALPQLNDPATAPFFKRLIARENITLIATSPQTSFAKWKEVDAISARVGIFRGLYSAALKDGDPVEEELAQIFAFQLYLMDRTTRIKARGLADGSIPSIFQRSGEPNIVYVGIFGTVLDYLSDGKTFSRSQTLAILAAIEEHFSGFESLFKPDDRHAAAERLTTMATKEGDEAVRAALRRAIAVIRSDN
jgi:hypothetical protein